MQSKAHLRVLSNFFLDGAKIFFGSMVVGIFVPSTGIAKFPIATFIGGIAMAATFLAISTAIAKVEENRSLSQT